MRSLANRWRILTSASAMISGGRDLSNASPPRMFPILALVLLPPPPLSIASLAM